MDNNNPYNLPSYQPSAAPNGPPTDPMPSQESQQHQAHHGQQHGHHGHDQKHHDPYQQHHQAPTPTAFSEQPTSTPQHMTPPTPAPVPLSVNPPQPPLTLADQLGVMPQPVVKVLSPRGVEYVFLTIVLVTGAFALAGTLLSLVNGETSFEVLSFPAAILAVCVPIFAWLFLRLKKAELLNPALRLAASKRRSTQFTQ